jgi:hypothetical protein
MVLKETRSSSQIPTPFPHRFPLNSHALTSVEGLLGQDELDAAIQTTSASKARRVDFGGCGPPICTEASCPQLGFYCSSSGGSLAIWSPSLSFAQNVSPESQFVGLDLPHGSWRPLEGTKIPPEFESLGVRC